MCESRLRWQCRRGMRELDELLARHLDKNYASGSEAEKQAFRELLELSDPELKEYLLGGENTGQSATDDVIRQILN